MNLIHLLKKTAQKPVFYVYMALTVYLVFGLSNITNFITADEHFWLPNYGSERIQEYWKAIAEHDWEDTRINDKPGITLAYFSGVALPFASDLINQQITFDDGTVKVFNPEVTKKLNFLFRFPLFIFNGLFVSFYLFWVLRRITGNERVAAWAVILMLLSPVLLGLNQIVNPDTLFWTFGIGTMFSFYAMLKFRERRDMWITMVLFGLTLASKYVGVIFFPFFLLLIGLDYLYRYEEYEKKREAFPAIVKGDLFRYFMVCLGAIAIFAFLMPAAITDTEDLFGTKEAFNFKETFPIFYAIFAISGTLILDASLFASRGTLAFFGFLARFRGYFEGIIYTILLATTVFVLFNWMLKNSLVDLTHIPFDAKTKASFTTENPFLTRFIVEFVPLVFALTPITLFLLIYAWLHSLLSSFRNRLFVFSISLFFLVFYLAVISQGLLVTVRYSILLFPLALTLGAFSVESITSGKRKRHWLPQLYLGIFGIFLIIIGLTSYHAAVPIAEKIEIENFIGNHLFLVGVVTLLLDVLFVAIVLRALSIRIFTNIPFSFITIAIIAISAISLFLARPHYFVYTNDLLPDRYLISGAWGYGGYEAAEYLNAKPNAHKLTLWTDAYGACEFFVGKCIHKQKVDTEKYPIDYLLVTLRGQLQPKFPHSRSNVEWRYDVGGRDKNYVKLFKNDPETINEDYGE